ncbi:MAG: glycosyltransferase family 39 protein, partial [Anaerolineales bacterium]|nr:glycosyltransferase family 39 protein [Anaerolineales bacterium]
GAPVGFLLLEKLVVTLLGDGERALRLLPFLAGCASLILFYLLARQFLSPAGLLTALALLAISPMLVYYASEVKQYSSDVFVALLLLYLFTRPWSQRLSYGWLVAGLLASWFSHPAVFVLAAIGLMLLWQHRQRPWPVLMLGAAWLASIGLLYLVNLRGLAQNDSLRAYWGEYFHRDPLTALTGLFANPAGLTLAPALLVGMALIGAGFLVFQKTGLHAHSDSPEHALLQPRNPALVFLLVFGVTYLASWLELYPFARRMILFLVPLVYLLSGAAVDFLWHTPLRLRFFSRLAAVLLAGFLLYQPLVISTQDFFASVYPEHIRPAVSYLNANYREGDVVYVYYWAVPAFRYYADPEIPYLAGQRPKDLHILLKELDSLRGQARVWVLFSHVTDINDHDGLVAHLDTIGQRLDQVVEPLANVYLYLYDLR